MIFKSFVGFEPPKFRGSPNIFGQSTKIFSVKTRSVVKLPKSTGARHYCPKIPWVPGTLGTLAN